MRLTPVLLVTAGRKQFRRRAVSKVRRPRGSLAVLPTHVTSKYISKVRQRNASSASARECLHDIIDGIII